MGLRIYLLAVKQIILIVQGYEHPRTWKSLIFGHCSQLLLQGLYHVLHHEILIFDLQKVRLEIACILAS